MAAALLVTAAACSSSTEGSARIRVDQPGFVTDGVKHAHLMAADAPESFRVVAENGTVVLESAPSSTAARWNDAYPAVRVLDLTAVTTPGRYRVEATGAVSPPFRIDTAPALFAAPVADTARFFVTQHDTAHTADRAADVSALAHADLARISDGPLKERLVADLERQPDEGVARAAADPFGAGAVYTEFDSVPHTFGLVITAALHRAVTGDTRYDAFGTTRRGWALGANAWGSSFVVGIGTTFPRCPEHQAANLTGDTPTGAVVNGPNAATRFTELNAFEGMKPCAVTDFAPYDGHVARYLDHVGAWQSVEPAIDFTSTGLLAFALSTR